jgi:hypothetical protein
MPNKVTPIRPDLEAEDDHSALTFESAVLWIRELEVRLARMERKMEGIRRACPLADRAPPT